MKNDNQIEKQVVLFDLGNTLIRYYRKDEFVPILDKAIGNVHSELTDRSLIARSSHTEFIDLAIAENREASDFKFMPMVERFERIFGISITGDFKLSQSLCTLFLEPIFETASIYPDAIDALSRLKSRGFKLGIVSNLPWGSPADIWRDELNTLGLTDLVDDITLCADVGWRKPAAQIFEKAITNLGTSNDECTFVGDDPEWDIRGSKESGMRPVLIDRDNLYPDFIGTRIKSLDEIDQVLGA